MKLLLDTHAILWWLRDDRRLKREARSAIAHADIVWISAAAGWEATIKATRGRLRLPEPFGITIAADDFKELPLTLRHAEVLAQLPPHHGDPFDRIMIAQARAEGATIVTHDRMFEKYDVAVLWT